MSDKDLFVDFLGFCRNATDQQLENILQKEWVAALNDKDRIHDYNAARAEALRRGWEVAKGQRIS